MKAFIPYPILRWFGVLGALGDLKPENEAVILFTSGTESMPKGVPLSHNNIVSNIRASLDRVPFFTTDRFLSSLPPFHSFGFSLTGLLPLLAGVKTFYSPNPADPAMQVRALTKWKTNLICSAPTFLVNILRHGKDAPV